MVCHWLRTQAMYKWDVLEGSALFDWKINIWLACTPKIRHLEHQEACATLYLRCFASLWKLRQFLVKYLNSYELFSVHPENLIHNISKELLLKANAVIDSSKTVVRLWHWENQIAFNATLLHIHEVSASNWFLSYIQSRTANLAYLF